MKYSFSHKGEHGRCGFPILIYKILASLLASLPLAAPAQDILPVRAAYADSTIAPFKQMRLELQGPPGETVSVAVRDGDVQTNACRENAATYLLLSSELKGYVRDAAYYLEADDAEHRLAADLLCLTQGWTRYDWEMMAGRKALVKRQPLEDGLYLDGRVLPRQLYGGGVLSTKKKRTAAADVSRVQLSVLLYNAAGGALRGDITTDAEGYYAFAVPECEGEWSLVLSTKKEEGREDYLVSINRMFSPVMKTFAYDELQLAPLAGAGAAAFRYAQEDYDAAAQQYAAVSTTLGEAVVRVRTSPFARRGLRKAWEVTRQGAGRRAQFRYKMDDEVEKCLSAGRPIPRLADWLMERPALRRALLEEKRPVGWIVGTGKTAAYSFVPDNTLTYRENGRVRHVTYTMRECEYTVQLDTEFRGDSAAVARARTNPLLPTRSELMLDTDGDREYITVGAPPMDIDELSEVYVSLDRGVTRYMTKIELPKLGHTNPFHVFVYPNYEPGQPQKGLRRTYYRGYNAPHTYVAPDYTQQPREADFRRTLLWVPDVRLDDRGRAMLTFSNSAACQRPVLSVEGVSAGGMPVVGL